MILLEVLKIWEKNEIDVDYNLMISFGPLALNRGGDSAFEYISLYDEPKVAVNVSDKFYWATADFEDVATMEDVELLRQAVKDCRDEDGYVDGRYASIVYAGRKRNLKVMPRYMKGIVGELLKDLPKNTVLT